MNTTELGVCAPKGFLAAGVHCGIRKNKSKPDLALILSDREASAAAVYTQNLVKGAPILVTKEHLSNGKCRAVICNSGNANTCNADGIEIAKTMCALVEAHTGVPAGDVAVASTGVIGQPLPIEPIQTGMPALVGALKADGTEAARAIMTTDTILKQTSVTFDQNGTICTIGGMAKGSGMIHPNMATMLIFLTTDAQIAPPLLQKLLKDCCDDTFNMITVDGDTSTNDMCIVLANGAAGAEIKEDNCGAFAQSLKEVMTRLSKLLAGDGEGATKLLECAVSGAKDKTTARQCAKSVAGSSLLKAAMFGADANWGRVLCALGYAGADIDITKVSVAFKSAAGRILVCENGAGVDFSEDRAKQILSEKEICIDISVGSGTGAATAWGCDLTYEYVRINGDYRS